MIAGRSIYESATLTRNMPTMYPYNRMSITMFEGSRRRKVVGFSHTMYNIENNHSIEHIKTSHRLMLKPDCPAKTTIRTAEPPRTVWITCLTFCRSVGLSCISSITLSSTASGSSSLLDSGILLPPAVSSLWLLAMYGCLRKVSLQEIETRNVNAATRDSTTLESSIVRLSKEGAASLCNGPSCSWTSSALSHPMPFLF